MKSEAIRKVYGRAAGLYDVIFGPIADFGRKRVVAQINHRPGGRLLEVGVGTGISLGHYDSRHIITGIDLSPEMLERAERRVREKGLKNVESLAVMDAQKMDFPDSSFDIVVAMYVMSVVPDPDKVIAEMQRVCKPGGKIYIVNHFSQESGFMNRVERFLEPYSDSLGWSPHFPIEACLHNQALTVRERKRVPPVGLFTVLVCDNDAAYQPSSETNGSHRNGSTASHTSANGYGESNGNGFSAENALNGNGHNGHHSEESIAQLQSPPNPRLKQ